MPGAGAQEGPLSQEHLPSESNQRVNEVAWLGWSHVTYTRRGCDGAAGGKTAGDAPGNSECGGENTHTEENVGHWVTPDSCPASGMFSPWLLVGLA